MQKEYDFSKAERNPYTKRLINFESDGKKKAVMLEGIEDDIRIDMGSDAMFIMAIQKISHELSPHVHEVQLNGEELLNLINSICVKSLGKMRGLENVISKDHHYILTVFGDSSLG